MLIPNKILTISLLVIIAGALGFFLILKKGPAASETSGGTLSAQKNPGVSGSGGTSASASQNPEEKVEAAPLPVKVVPVRRGELVLKLKSPGEAFTDRKIALKAEVSGNVKNLYAAEGRHVKESEMLVELDDREYQLKLEKADAQRLKFLSDLTLEKQFPAVESAIKPDLLDKLTKTEADLKRASEAFQKGLISQIDFEKAQKEYEIALIGAGQKRDEIIASSKGLTQQEIDVKIARMEVEKSRIRAPFAGIITDVKISAREHLGVGQELFTLVDISRIHVRAKVLESEIGKMSVGREVDLRFSAYPGKVFRGVVEAISPIVNSEDKTCAVHISVSNPTEEIKPGMHAEVEIAAEIYKNKLLVPQEAILVRGGRKLVFVVEGGLAKWRYVQVGLENEDFAEILPGGRPEEIVKEGDMVITEGHFTLAHDTRVSVKE